MQWIACYNYCYRNWCKYQLLVQFWDPWTKLWRERKHFCGKYCRGCNSALGCVAGPLCALCCNSSPASCMWKWLREICTKPSKDEIDLPPNLYSPLISLNTIARVACVVCSILGMAVSGYFYCGCLFYMFVDNHTLRRVRNALRLGGERKALCFDLCLPIPN